MSAGITYEGALQSSGGLAAMFQGKSFWLSQRVPCRGQWKDHIKKGGGLVVPLEKNADYLIADRAFPLSAPEGSISWQWIAESVAARRLLDADGYLVKAKAAPSQPSTAHEGARPGGRTPFTEEDDKFLIAYIRAASKEGKPLLGLAIYKELEKKNPRHTFQSWRDRWKQRLQYQNGVLSEASDGAPVLPSPESAAYQPEPVSQPPQAKQCRGANPKTTPNPSRRSTAAESPRPNVAAKSSRPSPAAASTGPGPRVTAASPRPSVAPGVSRPKATSMRPQRSAAAEAPRPIAPLNHGKTDATAEYQRPNAVPEHAKSSTVAELPRPHGTPEHAKPTTEPSRSGAVPTPQQPTVPPEYVPSGVTPQPSRPSAAPGFAWPLSVAPQTTPVNTVGRSPELSSSLKRKSIFSEEEDHLLAEYVQQMWEERGKDADSSLDIFADFELDFPQHSARVWRHRWIRYLRPQFLCLEYQGYEEGPTVTETPQASNTIQQLQVDTAGRSSSIPPTKPTTPETRRRKGKEAVQAPVSSPAHSRSSALGSRRGQTEDTSRRPILTSSPVEKQYRDDLSEPSLGADPGYMDEEEDFETVPTGGTSPISMDQVAHQRATNQAFVEPPGNPPPERQVFAGDYEIFWHANNDRQERFNSWPTIRGRTVDLFDLWKVATSQHVVPAERDWEVIAEKLGFDWVELDGVEHELANYFEEHLGKFEELMADFDNGEESIEDEDVATPEPEMPGDPDETGMADEAGPRPSRQPFNSSPPKLPSLKRTQAAALLAYPEVEPKRRKFDRSTEISSTPDDKNGTAHLRTSFVSAAVSPSDRRISTLPRSSRSPKAIRKAMGSPSPHRTRGLAAEPETQEFHYGPETQTVIPYSHPSAAHRSKSQSEADVTVSQQLTLESEGFVEVSASARTPKKPRSAAHISPLRRQLVQDPFVDSPDDEPSVPAPKPRFGKGRNPLLPALAPTMTKKRRSLPWPQDGEAVPNSRPAMQPVPGPAKAPGRPKFIRPPRSDEPSSPAAPGARTPVPQADPSDDDAAPIPASCDPLEVRYLRGVLRDWERRGYPRDVALRGLDATTWTRDDITGDVIELLQRGERVPDNWFGVWTEADDKRLNIVDGCEVRPPNIDHERLARRRDRALHHLKHKFDADGVKDRRHWLSMKHALEEAKMKL